MLLSMNRRDADHGPAPARAVWAAVVLLALCAGCRPAPPAEPPSASVGPPLPWLWMADAPPDRLLDRGESRLVMRLSRDEVAAAQRLYGEPRPGAIAGWWIRPLAPRPTGAWMVLSVSGGIYAVIAPPTALPEAGKWPAHRVGLAWRDLLRDR